ncbi:MAG: hypothetical protein HOL66_09455 [Rhodospirillaceae bacterium]|nr:hypothetical protein [Rhodospirillaceae bacterium]MBT5244462.1 hypothetical protein [Rhodospirillaceae bacterium]MBT5561404.1 hypothetical protein [Rhodospirillaceae bacterium]MBT6242044.1 hypothetical protein [Rhodospirillaceae bacterium]
MSSSFPDGVSIDGATIEGEILQDFDNRAKVGGLKFAPGGRFGIENSQLIDIQRSGS